MSDTLQDITGVIFDIKKYAIHDGPGIRTTVFLKGCPLRCKWCHNPESWIERPEMMFHAEFCTKCGICRKQCQKNAITLDSNGYPKTNMELCNLCRNCVSFCPENARQIAGKLIGVSEVIKEVNKDRIFYDESGGGVTFSGGEPLMQDVFLNELLRQCRKEGIHTALDTSLFASRPVIQKIMPFTNLFLCDIKHLNPDKHKKYTGVDNQLILDNLRFLDESGCELMIRVPVVPGFNDTKEEIQEICDFAKSLNNNKHIDLLPYHSGGVSKAKRLTPAVEVLHCSMPSKNAMEELGELVKQNGFEMKAGG